MAGTDIINRDADASLSALTFSPPVAGFEYWNYFGGASAVNGRNLIADRPQGVVVGAPVVETHSVDLQHLTNYIDTRVKQLDSEVTMIAVVRLKTEEVDLNRFIIANNGSTADVGGTTVGCNMFFSYQSSGNVRGSFNAANTAGNSVGTNMSGLAAPMAAPKLLVGRLNLTTGVRELRNHTDDLVATSAADLTGLKVGGTWRIGSGYTSSAGTATVYMAAIARRLLSDTEVAACVARIRSYYGRRAITV